MPSLTYDEWTEAQDWTTVPVDRPEEYADRLAAFLLDGYDVSAAGS